MLAAMGLGVWIGYELDEWLKPGFPVFLIAFALLSFGLSLYLVIKSLPKY